MKNVVLVFCMAIFGIFSGMFIWIVSTGKYEPQINILTLILIALCMIGFVLSLGFLKTSDD